MIDDPFLETITGQCGTRVLFRHQNESDATYFGRQLALPQYDPLKIKWEHWEDEQYQDRIEIWQTFSQSITDAFGGMDGHSIQKAENSGMNLGTGSNYSDTSTDSSSAGESESANSSHTDSRNSGSTESNSDSLHEPLADQLRTAHGHAHSHARTQSSGAADSTGLSQGRQRGRSHADGSSSGSSNSRGVSAGRSKQSGTARQRTWMKTRSVSASETPMPIMAWRRVLRQREHYTYDEQTTLIARDLATQTTGTMIMSLAAEGVDQYRVPMPKQPFEGTPKFAQKKLHQFFEELARRPHYHRHEDIATYRVQLLERLLANCRKANGSDDSGDDPFPK